MKKKQMMFIDLDERGKTTDYCRALHAKMGSYIGNGVRGGVVDLAIPNSKTRRGRVQDMGETVGTLDTGANHCKVEGRYRIRKLTPRECFRLQGWTDDYFEKAQFVNSDSQLYKQAGNGVTVNVIYAIAKRFEGEE